MLLEMFWMIEKVCEQKLVLQVLIGYIFGGNGHVQNVVNELVYETPIFTVSLYHISELTLRSRHTLVGSICSERLTITTSLSPPLATSWLRNMSGRSE
jgi:hypothetical protein